MGLEEIELDQERGWRPWLDLGRCSGHEGGKGGTRLATEGVNEKRTKKNYVRCQYNT